jgi:chromosome partitioning protein
MILAVANVKGGAGKTTLATNLAVARAIAGRDVLLVDADNQGSSADFTALRTEQMGNAGYAVARLLGREVRSEVGKMRTKFDEIIIDVGGRDSEGLRAALTVADTVLIPVLPSSFDVWSFSSMVSLAREARAINPDLRVLAVLNAADAQGSDNRDARDLLRETEDVEALPCQLGRRKAYRNAAAQGRSVLDMTPKDSKAIEELTALVAAIYSASK